MFVSGLLHVLKDKRLKVNARCPGTYPVRRYKVVSVRRLLHVLQKDTKETPC